MPIPDKIALITAFFTGIGIIVAIAAAVATFLQAFYPAWREDHTRRLLTKRFNRGPYDIATITSATKYYIRPKCQNLDPAQEVELRHALIATREDLFEKVDNFLDKDSPQKHLLILADSGTGKTSFVLNYYAYNARRPKRKQHIIALVPLGIKDADDLIQRVDYQEDTILFLDALDEDTKAIENYRTRVLQLMDMCRNFRKVVITCRTQFFPRDEEIPTETGIVQLGPKSAGDRGVYKFWKLYLSPFDDDEVDAYIKKRYPIWKREERYKARRTAQKIPMLSVRPMLLAHIPDLVASKKI